jgi:hypothetical protein
MADKDADADAVAGDEDAEYPWDDQTDDFITDIDATVTGKYSVSLRTLLTDPAAYADTKGIGDTINSVKKEVDDYFDDLMDDLKVEQDELDKAMQAADSLYTKMDQAISSKAAVARVPYIKPVDVDSGDNGVETIHIDQYNNNVDTLITKFINISNYIANLSTTYKKYNLGSWLFSGERDYTVEVSQPESMVITVEDAHDYISDGLESASAALSGGTPAAK